MRAIVSAIFINSPTKKFIGLAPPGFRTLLSKRKAKNAFGNEQHSPPSRADIPEERPDANNATSAAMKAVAICNRIMRAMPLPSFTTSVRFSPICEAGFSSFMRSMRANLVLSMSYIGAASVLFQCDF